MAIDIKCRLVGKLQVQNGNSARGAWCKQDFIVETIETYPRKICMNVWGEDKVAELSGYNIGENLTISVNIELYILITRIQIQTIEQKTERQKRMKSLSLTTKEKENACI